MANPDSWRSSLDPQRVMSARVTHWQEHNSKQREDHLAVEEPFEIRIEGRSLAVIMRTPGHDRELAMGFLFSEGVIQQATDLKSLEIALDEDGLPLDNVLNVTLHQAAGSRQEDDSTLAFTRYFAVSSSCGLCGKRSIEDVLISVPPLPHEGIRISANTIYHLPAQLRSAQSVFTHTGGLHAAGLFDVSGEMLLLREDVGRHNAVDKLIGHGLLSGTFPYSSHILLVSGRVSFEILQKALLARIPCIAAISAPSSLAVDMAGQSGITLIGFLRDHTMNVYTHAERII